MSDLLVTLSRGLGIAEPAADSKQAVREDPGFSEHLSAAIAGLLGVGGNPREQESRPDGDAEAAPTEGAAKPDESESADPELAILPVGGQRPEARSPGDSSAAQAAAGSAQAAEPADGMPESAMTEGKRAALSVAQGDGQQQHAPDKAAAPSSALAGTEAVAAPPDSPAGDGSAPGLMPVPGAAIAEAPGRAADADRASRALAAAPRGDAQAAATEGDAQAAATGGDAQAAATGGDAQAAVKESHAPAAAQHRMTKGATPAAETIEQEGGQGAVAERQTKTPGRAGETTGDEARDANAQEGRQPEQSAAPSTSLQARAPAQGVLSEGAATGIAGHAPANGAIAPQEPGGAERAERILTHAAESLSRERLGGDTIHIREIGGTEAAKRYEASLRLHPRELGELRIELQMDGDEFSARIVVESEAARTQLQGDLARLRDALTDQGLAANHVEVQVDQGRAEARDSRGGRSGEGREERSAGAAVEAGAKSRFGQRSLHEGVIDLRA